MRGALHRTVALLLAPVLTLLTTVAAIQAQAPTPVASSGDLQSRLDSLEKQNQDLAASLQQLQALIAKQQGPARQGDLWEQSNDVPFTPLDPGQVNEILQKQMPRANGDDTKQMPDDTDLDKDLDKKQVESIISNWWKEKEKKKKEDDELKKLQDEAEGHEVGKDLNMKVIWNHGLWAETADKAFRVHVGGRAQFDSVGMDASPDVKYGRPGGVRDVDDAVNFRRGRLAVEGTFWEVIGFNCEWDFINTHRTLQSTAAVPDGLSNQTAFNTPVPTDLWIEINKLPLFGDYWISNFRAGNQKPPISFEHLTSSRFLNFLERSFMFDAWMGGLDNGFRPGFQLWNYSRDERITWAVGVFKNNQSIFGWNVGDGEYDLTGRITCLPVWMHEGRCLVHLGLGGSVHGPDDLFDYGNDAPRSGRFRQRARTMLRNGPASLHTPLVDTTFFTSRQFMVVPEFAMVWGPFSLVAEYFGCWFENTDFEREGIAFRDTTPTSFPRTGNVGTTFFHGAYVEALYFLTGEHRPYNKYGGSGAAFTRVVPYRPFYFVPGEFRNICSSGAWQVGARYQWVDLEDKGIPGGVLQDVTLGLNWFLNPNLKFQWNYSVTHRDYTGNAADGNVQGLGMRVAWDF